MKVKKALKRLAEAERKEAFYQDRAYSASVRPIKKERSTRRNWGLVLGLCAVVIIIAVVGIAVNSLAGGKKSAVMSFEENSSFGRYDESYSNASGSEMRDDIETLDSVILKVENVDNAKTAVENSDYYSSFEKRGEHYYFRIEEDTSDGIKELLTGLGSVTKNGEEFTFPVGEYLLIFVSV